MAEESYLVKFYMAELESVIDTADSVLLVRKRVMDRQHFDGKSDRQADGKETDPIEHEPNSACST